MALDTTEALDLSKENVQPLRQGRKAAHLKTALQAQTDPDTQLKLQKQREQYEYMIRMYEGNDPLQPYWNYVAWLQQSYTKLGRECNFENLLEDAIIKFKDCDKYKQDPRFVQLMVKYINMQSNPLELYQHVYNQGMGTMCSSFYKAWAEELDKNNDIKRADQIYQLGIQCRAQPLNELQAAHVQFQLSIARRMLEGNMIGKETEQPTRNVLSKLQPSKVKSTRSSKDAAGVFQSTNNSDMKNKGASLGKFKVYQEDENEGLGKSEFKNKTEKLPKGSVADRENVMKADKWCGHKQKQRSVFKSSMPTTPSFQVHEDPEADCEKLKTVTRPGALRARTDNFRCRVAVFEDPDPTKIPMYPKHLVYVGGRDVQLEELRAAMYRKKREMKEEKLQESLSIGEMETKTANCSETEPHKISTQIDSKPLENLEISPSRSFKKLEIKTEQPHSLNEMARKNESGDSDTLIGISEKGIAPAFYSPSTSITVNTRAAINVIQQMWESPLPCSNNKRQKSINDSDESFFKIPQARKPNPVPFKLFVDEDAHKPTSKLEPSIENSSVKDCNKPISSSSVKPPFSLLEDFPTALSKPTLKPENKFSFPIYCEDIMPAFTNPSEQKKSEIPANADVLTFPDFVDNMPFTSTQKPAIGGIFGNNKTPFQIFSDDGIKPLSHQVETRNTFSEIDKLLFPVKSDEDIPSAIVRSDQDKASGMLTPVLNEKYSLPLIIPVNLADTPLEPENKENYPPKNYATPVEKRPISGILTAATDVPVRELDSEESEEEDDYCKIYPRSNDFDEETCTTKAFALNLASSSTPFSRHLSHSRKSLIYNELYNTTEDSNTAKSTTENSKCANGQHLSLILENSKEQGSNSSGGSSATNK